MEYLCQYLPIWDVEPPILPSFSVTWQDWIEAVESHDRRVCKITSGLPGKCVEALLAVIAVCTSLRCKPCKNHILFFALISEIEDESVCCMIASLQAWCLLLLECVSCRCGAGCAENKRTCGCKNFWHYAAAFPIFNFFAVDFREAFFHMVLLLKAV